MEKIKIVKNGCCRMATVRDYNERLKAQGFEIVGTVSPNNLVEYSLEYYKTGGGWYTFPDGIKEQGEKAVDYYEAHKGEWN